MDMEEEKPLMIQCLTRKMSKYWTQWINESILTMSPMIHLTKPHNPIVQQKLYGKYEPAKGKVVKCTFKPYHLRD